MPAGPPRLSSFARLSYLILLAVPAVISTLSTARACSSRRHQKWIVAQHGHRMHCVTCSWCAGLEITRYVHNEAVCDTRSEGGPASPPKKNFPTSYMRTHTMRNNNQILHGDHTTYDENFTRSTTNADAQRQVPIILPSTKFCDKPKK